MGKRKKKETRYEKLFGTPERAAKTVAFVTHKCYFSLTEFCDGCPLWDPCQKNAETVKSWMEET